MNAWLKVEKLHEAMNKVLRTFPRKRHNVILRGPVLRAGYNNSRGSLQQR